MGQVDPSLSVQSGDCTTAWKTPAEFQQVQHSLLHLQLNKKPLKGPTDVKAYAALFSKLCLNTIKFENEVYSYIQTYNVYIQPDIFQYNSVVSPGAVVHVYPTLVHKDNLLKDMKTQLAQNKVPLTEVCTAWMQENVSNHKTEDNATVPNFCLGTAKAGWEMVQNKSK
eukprot:14364218-Ditylum_brightwellii.AAC.1